LRKTFGIKKGPRSQSVDRYQSSSLREGDLLKPPTPGSQMGQNRLTDDPTMYQDGRQVRSNSIGSSIKRIFKKDKKSVSRDNSLTRQYEAGRSGYQQEIVTGGYGGYDRSRRQGTPVPPGRDEYPTDSRYDYSSSLPSTKSPQRSRYLN